MRVNTLIIGAGITGLSAANFGNEDYLILEKENAPGGLCRTFYVKDYIWDYAGHFFHFATKEIRNYFEQYIAQDEMCVCNKKTKIFYGGDLIDYPFQTNIHQLSKQEFIECLYDLFFKSEKKQYNNFEEMLYGKFGRAITEKFLKPYNEKLYACNLNELDTDAMGRFFPYANVEQIVGNMKEKEDTSYNSWFEYPKKGANTFIVALLKNLDNSKIHLNTQVKKIDIKNKTAYTKNEKIQYDKLISTIPLNQFLDITHFCEQMKTRVELNSNKVLVFNMGFDKKSIIDDIHWIYFPQKDINFYRVGFYDNILGTDKLSIYVEIGMSQNQKYDLNIQLKETLMNLKKVGIIDAHKLVAYNHVIINPAYVHISSKA